MMFLKTFADLVSKEYKQFFDTKSVEMNDLLWTGQSKLTIIVALEFA